MSDAKLTDEELDDLRAKTRAPVAAYWPATKDQMLSLLAEIRESRRKLAQWSRIMARADIQLRHPDCDCHQEIGDSPCIVHGLDEEERR